MDDEKVYTPEELRVLARELDRSFEQDSQRREYATKFTTSEALHKRAIAAQNGKH